MPHLSLEFLCLSKSGLPPLTYVRLSAFPALSSAIETSVSACTRVLDRPDIPLLIRSTKFLINIILDMLIIPKFHVGSSNPTVNMQAVIQLSYNMSSTVIGLGYFIYCTGKHQRFMPQDVRTSPAKLPGSKDFDKTGFSNIPRVCHSGYTLPVAYQRYHLDGIRLRYGLGCFQYHPLGFDHGTRSGTGGLVPDICGTCLGGWRARVGSNTRRAQASRSEIVCDCNMSSLPQLLIGDVVNSNKLLYDLRSSRV